MNNVHPIFQHALDGIAPKADTAAESVAGNLQALVRLLESGATPALVVQTAYQLGKLDGGMEMASLRSA